ncbi:MAG: hypothetical protein EA360_00005 [Balneolaceae bacterium]|nr:MAG: hypothetical protein EA360_00005 [Balneolaceae bacterium]
MSETRPVTTSRFRKLFTRIFLALLFVTASLIASLLVVYELRYTPPLAAPAVTEFSFSEPVPRPAGDLLLLPVPKEINRGSGTFTMPQALRVDASADILPLLTDALRRQVNRTADESGGATLRARSDNSLPPEGFRLRIRTNGIEIEYADPAGLFYSVSALGQIYRQGDGTLPVLEITDWPDLPLRGVMLDISRDKIPTMDTLHEIVDLLALMRYNHIQLYVEGFSFAYPSFRELWEETETPVTGEEMQQLEAYAAAQMIELVPNQNLLGHMNSWLAAERFEHLAECPDGFLFLGLIEYNSTLDVSNPESFELVKQMNDDMLPWFSSRYFNANLDEPFELGQCNTRELAAERGGAGYLYLDFLKELNTNVNEEHGRRMMIWGDIAAKYPQIIPEIPENVILIEWGYESIHPFDEHVARIRDAGLDAIVAPGTSSWTTFTGRTENMMGNIESAVDAAMKHGALGMLLTDWGDLGHWQYWPVSWAPLTYGAAISWNAGSRDHLRLEEILNEIVFRDLAGIMGPSMLDLGRYNQFEEFAMVNMTTTMQTYLFGLMDPVMLSAIQNRFLSEFPDLLQVGDELIEEILSRFENPGPYQHQAIIDYTSRLAERVSESSMDLDDRGLIIEEVANAVRMIHLGALTRHYVQWMREYSRDEKMELLLQMRELSEMVMEEHERLWLSRNREGGLDRSLSEFKSLQSAIDDEIRHQQRGPVLRSMGNVIRRVIAAAAALYIDR